MADHVASHVGATSRAVSPRAFAAAPSGRPIEALCRDVVEELRGRSSGLEAAVRPLVALQHHLLKNSRNGGTTPEELTETLMAIQGRIIATLAARYDALDGAARESELPFAEIDHAGRIVYANKAMAEHIPQPERRDFASLFGARARRRPGPGERKVREPARRAGMRWPAAPVPGGDRPAARPGRQARRLAVLLGLRAEELRLDAALDGILRADLTGRITFANNKVLELLNLPREEVLGTELARWFTPRTADKGPPIRQRVGDWLKASAAIIDDELTLQGAGQAHPIRIGVVPSYDGPEHHSGILMTFRDVAEDLARQDLRKLLVCEKDPRAVILEAIRIVRRLIPCDLAVFGTYTEDMRLYRAQTVEPTPSWHWATRWFDISDDVVKWLQREETWDNDVPAFVRTLTPEQKDDPVVQAVERDGLSKMVVLPVRGPGGRFRCVLTLLTKDKDRKFGAEDLRVLRDLGLEEVFLAAEAALEQQQAECLRALKRRLNEAPNARALARILAQGVVQCFGWEYAAVFRVDRKTSQFELFEQVDATVEKALNIPADHRQGLDQGMLGHCYRAEKVLVLPRVASGGHVYDFIKTAPAQASAMTVPLRLNGRIELILDLEASEENAFAGPDKRAAETLAADCEQILAGRWHETIGHALMDAIEQAAIIVDVNGTIRRINAAARELLGDVTEVALETFGADKKDRRILADGEVEAQEPTRVTLSPAADVRIPTQASQQPLHDDYGHRMWLFTNLADQQWEVDRRYLEETVSEVARHTRAPLMIADGLLRGAADLLRRPGFAENCANLLEKASNQLLKADLTFERLSDSLTAHSDPDAAAEPFDVLALLRQVVGSLPQDDAVTIELRLPEDRGFAIRGWPERLAYAFRSVLGFLLLSGREERIVVAAQVGDSGALRIEMRARRPSAPPASAAADPIAQGEEQARQMVALAPKPVETAIALHHGTFETPEPDQADAVFVITLPSPSEPPP